MNLTVAQQQALAAIRARYASTLTAYVARVNSMRKQHATSAAITATDDTIYALLGAERAAADSVVTPEQQHQFNAAMQVLRWHAGVPSVRHKTSPSTASSASAAPLPAGKP